MFFYQRRFISPFLSFFENKTILTSVQNKFVKIFEMLVNAGFESILNLAWIVFLQ